MDDKDVNIIGQPNVSLKAADSESGGSLTGVCVRIHRPGAGLAHGETGGMKGGRRPLFE
jgi:hypothetical protein